MSSQLEKTNTKESISVKRDMSILIGYLEYLQTLHTSLEGEGDHEPAALVRHNLQCVLDEFLFDQDEFISKLKGFLDEIPPETLGVEPLTKKLLFEHVYEKLWTSKNFRETLLFGFDHRVEKALELLERSRKVKTELLDLSRFSFIQRSELSRVRVLFLEFRDLAILVQHLSDREDSLDLFAWREEKKAYRKRFSRFFKPFIRKFVIFHESQVIKSLNNIFDLEGIFEDFEEELDACQANESNTLDFSILSSDFPVSCLVLCPK